MTETAIQEQPSVFRTRRNGCYEKYTGAWGSYLRLIDDPEANVVINKEDLESFELREDIHQIPADVWQRWVQLCFYFVDKVQSSVEVSIRILRSEEDPSVYRFLVPEQTVTGASVRAKDFNKAIDLETGEVIEYYPPRGWIPVGSSHSHNTMPSFFSSIDDEYELGDPGIHIVVGGINTQTRKYTIASSVVGNGRRFNIPYDAIIDTTPVDDCTFHKDVLSYVKYEKPEVRQKSYALSSNSAYHQWHRNKSIFNNFNNLTEEEKDPFHFSSDYKPSKKVQIWNVEDPIIEYLQEYADDLEEMKNLKTLLQSYIDDIDVLEELNETQLISC